MISSFKSTPFVVSVKRNFLLCSFSWERPYSTSCFTTFQFISGSPPKKSTSKVDAVSGVCDQEIQCLLSDLKAHEGAASMVLAFLCEAVLAGKVAVMGNMKAECLHDRLTFLEIDHIVFVNIRSEQLLRVDELLNIGERILNIFCRVLYRPVLLSLLFLVIREASVFPYPDDLRENLHGIVEQRIHGMNRSTVYVQNNMVSIIYILMYQS